jgi:predicted AAA+ superfamily ATPase
MHEQLATLLANEEPLIARNVNLATLLDQKEITVVTGVRRCGKSSLIRAFIRSLDLPQRVIYLNFEDPRLVPFEATDFETLYSGWLESKEIGEQRIAIFDEVQNVAGWERWMNFFTEQKKFKVFVTGSNSKILSSELATHLTGRHTDLQLYPLSFAEVCQSSKPVLAKKILRLNSATSSNLSTEEHAELRTLFLEYFRIGGFPRSWTLGSPTILGDYYTDILHRDIVRRHSLRQSNSIARFGSSVMSDLGRPLNKSKLARDINVKEVNTTNSYLSFFEECFLGFEIKQFDTSVRRQMRNFTKFYAIDPVLATRVGVSDQSRHGFYLENFVFIELKRRASQIFYWRGKEDREVDFVIETRSRQLHLIQVAWDISSVDTLYRELAGFETFEQEFPQLKVASKTIITVEQSGYVSLPTDVTAVPFPEWAMKQG